MSITAIILAKNEETMIANCIDTLKWCDEIMVIDTGSTDETAKISESLGARVVGFASPDFAKIRNEGLKRSKTDWIFYVDADERVTPELAREVMVNIETNSAPVFTLRRLNYCYGSLLQHGGWENDTVTRIFKRQALQGWKGEIHESPVFQGTQLELITPLIHLTHRSTRENLHKSAQWTGIEAKLLFESGIKPVTITTLIRKGFMEFIRRAYVKKGYQDGMTGMVEAIVQGMNRVMVYIQVWELQQKPPIMERYNKLEKEVAKKWVDNKDLK